MGDFATNENLISVAPNPVHNVLLFHSGINNASQIIISDFTEAHFLTVPFIKNHQSISVQKIPPGIYSLQLLNDKNKWLPH